ncbi:hemagglutinin repeat-containing protein, partial [Dyella flava]
LGAGDQLALSAGHDITLNAVTDQRTQATMGYAGKTLVSTGQYDETLHGTSIDAFNGVAITAGNNLTSVAGAITSANGDAVLMAGHDINLMAGQETHSTSRNTVTAKSGFLSSSKTITQDTSSDTDAVGTYLGGNNLSVAAGNDLHAQAAYLNAGNALTLAAGHDIHLTDAQDVHSEAHETQTKSFSFFSTSSKRFGSVDPEWRSHSSSTQITQSTSVGSVLSGDSVTVAAGHDLAATNAQIVGTDNVLLAAGNNLTLNAGQNTYDYQQADGSSHSGLMNNGGLSVLIGSRSTKDTTTVHDVSYNGSTVGSVNGSVTLSAGNDVHITGSDVLSNTATTIVGKQVTIDAAVGTTDITQTQKVSQGGINFGIGGTAANVANSVYYSAQRGSQVHDDRLKALYAAQAAQTLFSSGAGQGMGLNPGQTGADAIANAAQGKAGIDFKIGIGGSSASSTTTSHDDTTYGSTVRSNGNVTIAATGGDLDIIGSQISGDNVALAAANNLNMLSQQETHTLQSNNQNTSAGVGVLFGTSGFGIYAQAAAGRGNAHGNGVTHTDSTINADGTLTLISGNDTTIKGAQLAGNQVIASIGNNLLIQSEQDTDDYASKQWQASGQVVIGYGGMSSGGGLSYNQSKVNSHYASVTDVSGIQAGDDGFDITVGGNTHLIGGVIASSADPGNNVLNTGSLTYESIHNDANYSASSVGFGGGYSSGGGGYGGSGFSGAPNPGITQKESSSSDTHAGIAQGTIIVRDNPNQDLSGLNRNPTLDNQALAPIFDAQKVQEKLEMGQVAGQVGMTAAGDLASYMANHATTPEQRASWSDGGTNKALLHGLVGAATAALGGGDALQGALGAVASEAASGAMQRYLDDNKITDPVQRNALMQLASMAIGDVVGGGTGASTALQGDVYNRQLHPDEITLAKKLEGESGGLYTQEQIEDALRISGNNTLKEDAFNGFLIDSNDASGIYDTSARWILEKSPDGKQIFLMQQLSTQISPDLANFISSSTGGASSPYSWTNEQLGMRTPKEPYIPYLAAIPDYISVSGGGLGLGGSIALNVHTGQVYAGGSGNTPVLPGASFAAGWLPSNLGESSATSAGNTRDFLTGASFNTSLCAILCAGANHAYGGDTAIELGGGIKVPAKGGAISTGVMAPIFSLPFTSGDKGEK